jgi:hypothetical protein
MNTQNDYYREAVELSQRIDKDFKRFSFCCAQVSGKRTGSLAADCKMSVATIEKYRNAYALKVRFEIDHRPSERVTKLWNAAPMSLWRKAAELESSLGLSLDKIWDYLETASEYGMTRESFSAHIDEKENHTPKWIRRLQSAIRFLKPLRDDYKGADMPPEIRTEFDRLVAEFATGLERLEAMAKQNAVEK